MRGSCVALVVALGAGAPGAALAACQFGKVAEVPVIMEGQRPTVMAKLNGQDGRFLVDTGAFFSGVTPEAAEKFKMKRSIAPFGFQLQGVGGQKRDMRAVAADTFSFANVGFHNTDFLLVGRPGNDLSGMIGENLMGPWDVEYDLANGVIRYFEAKGCGSDDNLAYWSQGLALSRVSLIEPGSIVLKAVVNAKIDGHSIRVQFDSGASSSVLNRGAAARAGIQVNSEGVTNGGVSYGIYGKGIENFIAPFSSFQIGAEEIKNTRLRVSDIGMQDNDMLLGADFFLSHRILISNSQKKVYFTYNGGPVFRLGEPAQQQRADAGPTASAPAPSPPAAAGEPKTAGEFARRAAAFAARRELPAALADYGRAIELEPENPAYYRARALIRLESRQPVLAMADLNEALKRKPDDPDALVRRGQIYLGLRDKAHAAADFDAALKLAPEDWSLIAQVGGAYSRAGDFEPAIRTLDRWVASNPKSEDLPRVLNARCYARAAWGKELDAALADCDLAMRRDRTSEVMENRGLVLLRMGRTDEAIAQYTAAIRAQPRAAPALYGRGLAELKKGDKAAGEADIAAAKAIAPGLAQQFQRFGLGPEGAPAPAAGKS